MLANITDYGYATTCGYKRCRPVTTGGGTELYPAPVMHGTGTIRGDLDYIIGVLEQHCLEARHKQFRLYDIDKQEMYLISQAAWCAPPISAELFAGLSESMQQILQYYPQEPAKGYPVY